MELRQLEYFLACCDHGTFTAAARALNVVQSAVSTSVARLEREVGEQLFDRTSTALILTEAGHAAIAPARAALRARQEVADAVAGVHGDIRGEVSLGALVNIATIDLAAAFEVVHQRHPRVSIAMRQSQQGSAGNIAALRSGALDLALLGGPDDELPGIVVHPLASEPLVLVCPAEHRLARAGQFSVADLEHERLIDYPPGWGTRAVTDRRIPLRHTVIEVADQYFGIQLACSGFGVTLVPRSVALSQTLNGIATCIDADLTWVISIAHSANRTPSIAAQAVLDVVVEAAAH